MNLEIRKFLIDQCVKGQPIYYEVIGQMLGLDLGLESQRYILSQTLGEISTYEHEHKRPLISSIAIYKQRNDHGYGFYSLCEELGIGKASKLSKELYGFTQMEECKRFWQKPENYKAFVKLSNEETHKMDFFTAAEIDFLASWGEKQYDKSNTEHVAAKNYIINSLGTKTQYWSNHLVKSIPGLDTFNWRMWSQKGWEDTPEGKVRVARFKPYTWARIYRKGDDNKDIFFTVGADGHSKELVYKLDYYFEKNSHLDAEQKEIVDKNIPAELRWKSIPAKELEDLDWISLLGLTASFIAEHLHVYDKLIKLAWGGDSQPSEVFSNFLRPQESPENGHTVLPDLNPSFKGVDKDYIQESIDKKEIGDAGEDLVKQYEINWLKNIGHADLAEEVKIVKDGMGFDVQSFDENRKPKYIEVKTTIGNSLTPFDYTINEKIFAEQNNEAYFIYRLYNYDEESNSADFFMIKALDEEVLMRPTTFKVYLKRRDKK